MGNLKAKLETERPAKLRCQFHKWYLTLDEDDQAVVKEVIHDKTGWTIDEARAFFIEHGDCTAGDKSLRNHRNGLCRECDWL